MSDFLLPVPVIGLLLFNWRELRGSAKAILGDFKTTIILCNFGSTISLLYHKPTFTMQKSVFITLLPIFFFVYACSEQPPRVRGTMASRGMVVTEHPLASSVGADILRQGGNAFDAAIAVQFALTVVLPRAGNISGGGFMVYRKSNGENGFLDYREMAPLQAFADMYLDEQGNPIPGLSTEGALASGIPGSVAGMVEIHKKFGTIPIDQLIGPAIALARDGYAVTPSLADRLNRYKGDFVRINNVAENFDEYPFLKHKKWKQGDTLRFKKLGETLERIKNNPYEEFYLGETGKQLVEAINKRGGIFSIAGLAGYKVVWRNPVIGDYKGYKIISAAPPSSGGVSLLQILAMASFYDLKSKGQNSPEYIHLLAEIENRVFADRSKYLGDPDFFDIPVEELTRTDYLRSRASDIDETSKTAVKAIAPGVMAKQESLETTHFSIVDGEGNAVAITTTLNGNFGSRVYLPELGIFMNNEMDDFSAKPGHPNKFGLLGGEFNAIAPEKRMLSSMTPTIVEKDGKLKMLLGSPGGSSIITSVAQAIFGVLEFDMTMQEAVNAPRFHSQWYPDEIMMEKRLLDEGTLEEKIVQMGHEKVRKMNFMGKVGAILVMEDGSMEGAADIIRSEGKAIGVE